MKILYFDTETTGTNSQKHEIIQVAGIIEIDGQVAEEFNLKVRPTMWDNIDPQALEVTKKTIEELKTYPPASEVFVQLEGILERHVDKYNRNDKFYPAGHNVGFDVEFLQAFWKKYGDSYGTGSYQNWRFLDTRILANYLAAHELINPVNITLSELCKVYNIPLDAHDAMNDIRATRLLHKAMMKHISEAKEILSSQLI